MDDFQEQRARIVDYLTISIGLALVPISVLVVSVAMRDGWTIGAPVQLTIFAVIWLLAWNRKLATVEIRGSVVMLFLFLTALSEVYRYGLVTATYPMLAVLPILGTVVGGMRFGVASIGVVVLAIAAVAAVAVGEGRAPELAMPDYVLSPAEWSIRIVNVAIAAGIGVFVTGTLYQFHQDSNLALRGRNTELAKSQARVVQSAKLAGLGYAIADVRTGEVKECDDRYAEMHGMSVGDFLSSKGRSDVLEGILLAEPEAERPLDRLLRGEALIADSRHVLPDGESRYIQKIFSPLNPGDPDDHRFEVVGQDVTETRTLQEQLFQTQKLDAIGKLTGGVAHDFNNLLAVILGNLELLQDEIAASDQTELLSNALEATVAGSQLTRSMLSFARRAQLAPSRVDLNHLVRNLRDWTGRTLPSTIDVEVALQEDLWPIDIDATSAESGLINLIVNARDAMPRGGRLTIATRNLHVDADSASLRGEDVEPGRYVRLSIADTGEGIPAENLENIFVPFFTTKPVGKGSGLGLAMLSGFMKQSGGHVRVHSEVKVGTTFELFFRAAVDRAAGVATSEPGDEASTPEEGRRTILLVEDNPKVRATMAAALVQAGYRVFEASAGDEAVGLFREHPDVDLLLTDIVMPGDIQGTDLAKALRERSPDLAIVFVSGYASDETVRGAGLRADDIRLMKPVRRADLLRAVANALADRRPSGV